MVKNTIRISSALLLNDNKDLLVVRKAKSAFFMLPGGKIEKDEDLIDTLLRELNEELNLQFVGEDFSFLGTHETSAVNEKDTVVQGNIFLLNKALVVESITNRAEIEEVCWITKANYKDYQLAHLLKEFALPRWLADFK